MFVSTRCWHAGTSLRPGVSLPFFMLEMWTEHMRHTATGVTCRWWHSTGMRVFNSWSDQTPFATNSAAAS